MDLYELQPKPRGPQQIEKLEIKIVSNPKENGEENEKAEKQDNTQGR